MKNFKIELNENSSIRIWYKLQYPSDEMGNEIASDVTFYKLFNYLDSCKDIYELIPADSLIRERCFKKLSEIMDVDYDYIYRQWMKNN